MREQHVTLDSQSQHQEQTEQCELRAPVPFPNISHSGGPTCFHRGESLTSRWHQDGPLRGWRDDSVVKSTSCSSRGPGFNSQQPNSSSQLSVSPVLGDLAPANIHAIKTPMHIK